MGTYLQLFFQEFHHENDFHRVLAPLFSGGSAWFGTADGLGASASPIAQRRGRHVSGPLYSKWFDAYNAATGVQINYQAIGSGGGINQLKNKTVDFGASDAPLSNADLASMPGQVVQIPTVAGAVAIIYNVRGLGSGLKLSGPVLADIYRGKIKKWNDPAIAALNAGRSLPNQFIAVAHRSDGSGTTNIFTNYLAAVSSEWKTKVGAGKSVDWPTGIGGKGNDGVAATMKQAAGGIGYFELAYARQNNLPFAARRNKSGAFVLPSIAGATAAAQGAAKQTARDPRAMIVNQGGRAYPIAGYTFIMYYRDGAASPKGRQVVKFLQWAMGPGQKYAAPMLYAPLPRAVVAVNQTKLR
ncbi:MAG TPA: phosphate ABC transporter substrate-binding protein PstS [Abditibacterium sp.]